MPNYENETCEGCRFYREELVEDTLHEVCLDFEMSRESGWPDMRDRCDRFAPSIECRKVLALEELAACCVGPRGGFYVEGPRDP
jgi:hypothetical protein